MISDIRISPQAQKQLRKVPHHVASKLKAWVDNVEWQGIEEVRKIPAFHDEPLKGKRKGQRSIRLSRSYRAIYVIEKENEIEFISIEEVSKHDY